MYAYACLYQSDTDRVMEVDPEEITLTFVCMRYPRKLLGHLKKARGMKVSRQGDGIYYLEGDALAMQLLVTRELSERDNYWLQHLRGNLKEGRELQESEERGKEQGEETKLISQICKKLQKHKSAAVIAEELEEPEERVSLICETARRFAPDYDVDEIYAALAERGRGKAGKRTVGLCIRKIDHTQADKANLLEYTLFRRRG